MITNLKTSKENALKIYKDTKKAYLENRTNENWIAFCNARVNCMRLGVRI